MSPYGPRESGGRSVREPGQVLTEAATVIFLRVVPAPTFDFYFCFAEMRYRPDPALNQTEISLFILRHHDVQRLEPCYE